jgi:hypothetical protein
MVSQEHAIEVDGLPIAHKTPAHNTQNNAAQVKSHER